MGENTITLKRDDLEQVVRSALRLGSQAFGVKHKRLVQGIMEEAEEMAVKAAVYWVSGSISDADAELLKQPLAGAVQEQSLYHHAGTGDYFNGEGDNLSELLRSRVKAHPAPEVPPDPREYRGMSAERAAFIAWMNDIPRVPQVETGCGVEECCPGLPADIVELAKWSRRVQIIEDLENLPGFDERGLDILRSLSAEQLEQVFYIAKR